MAKKMTSIQVSKETKDRLAKLGSKGETYDYIICELIKLYIAWQEDAKDLERKIWTKKTQTPNDPGITLTV